MKNINQDKFQVPIIYNEKDAKLYSKQLKRHITEHLGDGWKASYYTRYHPSIRSYRLLITYDGDTIIEQFNKDTWLATTFDIGPYESQIEATGDNPLDAYTNLCQAVKDLKDQYQERYTLLNNLRKTENE